jgi:hypothetical protein
LLWYFIIHETGSGATSLHLEPTKKFEQDEHDQTPIENLVRNHAKAESRIPVMRKEVIVGAPHLIENEQPNEHKKNALYGQSIDRNEKLTKCRRMVAFPV